MDGPAGECRPAARVMGPERHARPQQVPGHVGAAVRPVVDLVVAERLSDPERVEGLAVDDAPAGAKGGGDVDVGVDEPGDAPVRPRPRERRAAGGDGGLGEGRASSRALEAKRGDALRAGARHRKRPAVGDRRQRPPGRRRPEREGAPPLTLGSPLARRAGGARPLDMDVPASVRRPPRQAQEAAVSVIEEVAAEARGLQEEGHGAGPTRGGLVSGSRGAHVPAVVRGVEGEAVVREAAAAGAGTRGGARRHRDGHRGDGGYQRRASHPRLRRLLAGSATICGRPLSSPERADHEVAVPVELVDHARAARSAVIGALDRENDCPRDDQGPQQLREQLEPRFARSAHPRGIEPSAGQGAVGAGYESGKSDQAGVSAGACAATGSATVNLAPPSGAFSATTLPPAVSTSWRTIASPRPDPGRPRARGER